MLKSRIKKYKLEFLFLWYNNYFKFLALVYWDHLLSI